MNIINRLNEYSYVFEGGAAYGKSTTVFILFIREFPAHIVEFFIII